MKKIKYLLILFLCLGILTCVKVNADMGPKPTVDITFLNSPYDNYYVALYSTSKYNGPWSYFDTEDSYYEERVNELTDIEKKFLAHEVSDVYFVGLVQNLTTNNNTYYVSYYPPSEFKIVIYIPDNDTFIESKNVISRYAFNSYFSVDFNDINSNAFDTITKTYDYSGEILHCLLRIALTIVIEVGLAILFKYRNKSLLFLVIVNVATQIILNVYLNLLNYNNGSLRTTVSYIVIEVLITIVEAIAYAIVLPKINKELKYQIPRAIIYAILANALSLSAGFILLNYVPGM